MTDPLFSPITNGREVENLMEELPIALNREHFLNFVLGFPRKYLVSTPRVEIVRHYLLIEGLRNKNVCASLSPEKKDFWRLCLVTRDRRFLFSRISGSLSYFGMNIVEAQALGNANAMVLDTFQFVDPKAYLSTEQHRRHLLHFMEEVLEGKSDLEAILRPRWEATASWEAENFEVRIDNETHPSATLLTLDCQDHFGLLYLVTQSISKAECDIEMAYVQTSGERVHDQFYLTFKGQKLTPALQEELKVRLLEIGKNPLESEDPAAPLGERL